MKPITVLKRLNEADQSWRNKVMESHLENDKKNPVWIIGWVRFGQRRFRVNAKVYMEPSRFGIDEGPTSKLWVCDARNNTICNYDRNWDVRPEGRNKEICDAILKYVEDFRARNPYEINESIVKESYTRIIDNDNPSDNEIINDFRSYIENKYNINSVSELVDQLKCVTKEDINDYISDLFYDCDNMDLLNKIEDVVRREYGTIADSNDESIFEPTPEDIEEMKYWNNDVPEYDDGDTNWAAEEEADAIERMERRYGGTFNESTKTQDFLNQVGADTAARRFAGIKGDTMSLDQYEKYQEYLRDIRKKDTSRYDITISYWDKSWNLQEKSYVGRSVKDIAKKFMNAKDKYDFNEITDYSDNLDDLLVNSDCNNMEEYLEKVYNER